MKELLLGNEAIARGLYEAGCKVVSSYPGTPSTEITEAVAKYKNIYSEWAPNEKVAAEVAIGASFAGARSFTAMKHVGLNVAADPLYTVSYTGVNGGLVFAVADDPGMHSSQNEQDTRRHAMGAKTPVLEPSNSQEALDFTKLAFEISEEYDTPVIVRLSTRVSHSRSIVTLSEPQEQKSKDYVKNPEKFVMMPAMAKKRRVFLEERQKRLIELAESDKFNTVETESTEIGVITSGISYEYAKEALGNKASILKLGMTYPLPEKLLKDFASKVKKLYVAEELDDIIEQHCKALGLSVIGKDVFPKYGEYSQNIIKEAILSEVIVGADSKLSDIPNRPPVLCPGCPHRALFHTLKKEKVFVSGDIGCYTLGALAPLNSLDTCVCMGASVGMLHGYNKANDDKTAAKSAAIIGDSTFIHSGITGLIDIVYNKGNSTVIIADNSITGMTGHQHNPTTGYTLSGDVTAAVDLEALVKSIGIKSVRVIDPNDLTESRKVIHEELNKDEPSVVISRRPCALLKYVKHKTPIVPIIERCNGCRLCMQIGCPAITIIDKKVQINETLCVGCDVCAQLCKRGVLNRENEK